MLTIKELAQKSPEDFFEFFISLELKEEQSKALDIYRSLFPNSKKPDANSLSHELLTDDNARVFVTGQVDATPSVYLSGYTLVIRNATIVNLSDFLVAINSRSQTIGGILFSKCVFLHVEEGIFDSYSSKKVLLPLSFSFDECYFLSSFYFMNVEFRSSLTFTHTRFFSMARFRNCLFHELVLLGSCRFVETFRVGSSQFSSRFTATLNTFDSNFLFSYSHVTGLFEIDSLEIHGVADFSNSSFDSQMSIRSVRLNRALNLSNIEFKQAVDITGFQFQNRDLTEKDEFDGWINLGGIKFNGRSVPTGDLNITLNQITKSGSTLFSSSGRVYGEHAGNKGSTTLEGLTLALTQYSFLAGNFAASSEPSSWEAADWCHSRYLDLKREIAFHRRRYLEWLTRIIFKLVFGNGIWLRFPLSIMLFIILSSAVLYATVLADDIKNADGSLQTLTSWTSRIGHALYFSTITFATVGYGDWQPTNWAELVAASEGLLGPIFIAIIIVVMTRKIIR